MQKLFILTGPTAVGKTDLSIKLAKKFNFEIISADSMQVYKYMDIGTAKITKTQMQGINHYLIDELYPNEEFNVYEFQQKAKYYVKKIYEKGKIPLIVGGTGFYIQSLIYDIDFSKKDNNSNLRNTLETIAKETEGIDVLYELLSQMDEKTAKSIHKNNIKKVIRAIEFYTENNVSLVEHNEEQRQKQSIYDSHYIVLNNDRAILYDNINKRVDKMFEDGLVDEVKGLLNKGYTSDLISMQGLGYKEVIKYLENKLTYNECVELIKRDTRHFAKRQLTWFRREKNVKWFDKSDYKDEIELESILIEEISKCINS